MTNLSVRSEKIEESGLSTDDTKIFNKHLFSQNSGEMLRSLARSLKTCHVTLSDEEIDSFVEDPENDAKVKDFLFGIDIVDGSVTCDGCGLQYQIKNSIVDTVDVIVPN